MKNLYIFIAFLFFALQVRAQSTDTTSVDAILKDDPETGIELPEITYEVEEVIVDTEEKEFSKGKHQAVVVTIPQANVEDVEDAMGKLIKSGVFKKVDKSGGELSAMGTTLKRISNEPMNVYSLVQPAEGSTRVWTFFEQDSAFISDSQNQQAFLKAKDVVRDFGVETYKDAVREELEMEQDKMDELKKNLEKMLKENADLVEGNKMNESKISLKEGDIQSNLANQENKRKEIQAQNQLVLSASGDIRKEREKQLKSLERDLKKLQKDNEALHRDIADFKSDIAKAGHEIDMNLNHQQIEKQNIAKQLWQVKSVEAKLNAIK